VLLGVTMCYQVLLGVANCNINLTPPPGWKYSTGFVSAEVLLGVLLGVTRCY
jgi:hypothetical protein